MRKNYTKSWLSCGSKSLLVVAAASMALTASAQQVPNVGFEEEWVLSRPWTSITDTLSMVAAAAGVGMEVQGLQPSGWIVSNVLGVVSELDEGGYGALGATEVGTQVEGCNSASALKLQNNPNPFMATQIVPGYVSLGTTWATNTLDWTTFQPANKDGGVFGGMECTTRPDALVFDYKREQNDAAVLQNATALVYAWKGTWTQADVPGNNSMSSETVKVTIIDRDRNILGMETAQGGEVTHTDDAELIAKSLQYIEGAVSDWTNYVLPIEYLSDSTPEKINVVLAANDYFDDQNIVNGNSLTLDNIRFAYYSRLEAVSIEGMDVPAFESDKYEYTVNAEVPSADHVVATLLGQGKSATVTSAIEDNVLTIVVDNPNGADVDGKTSHTYTIIFSDEEGQTYDGYLNIEMMGGELAKDKPATIVITPEDENHCTFTLPNFSIDLGSGETPMGDIVVPNVEMTAEEGRTHYVGSVTGMELMGGALVADVDLDGYITDADQVNMTINVLWNNIPINVTFSTTSSTAINGVAVDTANYPVEYFNLNGVRLNGENLSNGIYIRRQGNEVSKILVK